MGSRQHDLPPIEAIPENGVSRASVVRRHTET